MATIVGAATALSASKSFDSRKLRLPSRRSLPVSERKGSFLVVRSDGSEVHKDHRAQKLIANAVATKADSSAASTASKPGYDSFFVITWTAWLF
nr:pyruvate dehydrogenase E1 component subunit beta-3, chloroplastic-like [Quercus suber]POE50004.1 pyruvate dehydrogenase e1 component subunit beta-3, chloroplastic [Quercus suber]